MTTRKDWPRSLDPGRATGPLFLFLPHALWRPPATIDRPNRRSADQVRPTAHRIGRRRAPGRGKAPPCRRCQTNAARPRKQSRLMRARGRLPLPPGTPGSMEREQPALAQTTVQQSAAADSLTLLADDVHRVWTALREDSLSDPRSRLSFPRCAAGCRSGDRRSAVGAPAARRPPAPCAPQRGSKRLGPVRGKWMTGESWNSGKSVSSHRLRGASEEADDRWRAVQWATSGLGRSATGRSEDGRSPTTSSTSDPRRPAWSLSTWSNLAVGHRGPSVVNGPAAGVRSRTPGRPPPATAGKPRLSRGATGRPDNGPSLQTSSTSEHYRSTWHHVARTPV